MRREEVNRYEEPELPSATLKQALLVIIAVVVLMVAAALMFIVLSSDHGQTESQPRIEQIDCDSCVRS